MATRITNQATLTFQYGGSTGTASSNIASTMLQDQLFVNKSSLTVDYKTGETIVYAISLTNNSSNTLSNISVIDDLATYTIAGPKNITPLTYASPAHLHINGQFRSELTPTVGTNNITFSIPSLTPGDNALILYKAAVNEYALLDTGSVLTNDVTVTATGLDEPVTTSYTVDVKDFADVQIVKSMTPNPVANGGILEYTFSLYNYGNMEATNVVLSDTFDPAPTNISVSVNGTPVAATDYTYENSLLTLPAATAATLAISIPAATFTQDADTGAVKIDPGLAVITVSGTI